jgi:uncharacterized protein (UPF0216 family)
MLTNSGSDRLIQRYLRDEFKVVNAHLPRRRKPLAKLLDEKHPHVVCNDGSSHLFKRKELDYLSQILSDDEQGALLLPIIMEVTVGQREIMVISEEGIEAKVLSAILDMPSTVKKKG